MPFLFYTCSLEASESGNCAGLNWQNGRARPASEGRELMLALADESLRAWTLDAVKTWRLRIWRSRDRGLTSAATRGMAVGVASRLGK
jgi:hypothetical protein